MGFGWRNWPHRSLAAAGIGMLAIGLVASFALFPGGARAQDACDDPANLRFAISAGGNGLERHRHFKPVLDYLRERTKKKVEIYIPASYDSTTQGLADRWIDVAAYTASAYLTAREAEPAIEPFAAYARMPGHLQPEAPGYELVLIAKKDSRFDKLRATKGATLGLVEQNSPTGDLLPRIALAEAVAGDLEKYFSKVVYTGGNDLSTIAVLEGKLDVAVVESDKFDEMVDNEMVLLESFNVLWRSPVIPADPMVYRAGLCEALKKQISDAFLTLHTQYQARDFLKKHKAGRMMPVSDASYRLLRDVRAARGQLKLKDKGKIN